MAKISLAHCPSSAAFLCADKLRKIRRILEELSIGNATPERSSLHAWAFKGKDGGEFLRYSGIPTSTGLSRFYLEQSLIRPAVDGSSVIH